MAAADGMDIDPSPNDGEAEEEESTRMVISPERSPPHAQDDQASLHPAEVEPGSLPSAQNVPAAMPPSENRPSQAQVGTFPIFSERWREEIASPLAEVEPSSMPPAPNEPAAMPPAQNEPAQAPAGAFPIFSPRWREEIVLSPGAGCSSWPDLPPVEETREARCELGVPQKKNPQLNSLLGDGETNPSLRTLKSKRFELMVESARNRDPREPPIQRREPSIWKNKFKARMEKKKLTFYALRRELKRILAGMDHVDLITIAHGLADLLVTLGLEIAVYNEEVDLSWEDWIQEILNLDGRLDSTLLQQGLASSLQHHQARGSSLQPPQQGSASRSSSREKRKSEEKKPRKKHKKR